MDVSKAAAGWLQPSSSCFRSPSHCICSQCSALFCGQSAGCGAVLTLLYNCQFFAAVVVAAAATDELSYSSACLSVCLCVPVLCGRLVVRERRWLCGVVESGRQWVCVCELKWVGYTSIFIWRHNWYWRTMLPSRCNVRMHWEKSTAHLFTFIAISWLMCCL